MEERPFVYVALSGDESASGSCVDVRDSGGSSDIAVGFHDDSGRRHELNVNGVFTSVAQPDQVFQASVQPLCQRVAQGATACSVATLGGSGPQLIEDEGLGAHAIRYLLQALEVDGRPGALRLGLCCFLSDANRPTDLLKNVQQKVPPTMQWGNEEGLDGQKFVFCASLSSAQRTVRAVLSAPSLANLLPRLSYALTLAVRTPYSEVPSRLSLIELRSEHAHLYPQTLRDLLHGTARSDMLSRAVSGCRASDCVVIGQVHSEAPRLQDGGVAWKAAQMVFEAAAALRASASFTTATTTSRALPGYSVHTPRSPGVAGTPSPARRTAVSPEPQKVHVDVQLIVPEEGGAYGRASPQHRATPEPDYARCSTRTDLLNRAKDAESSSLTANQRARDAEARVANLAHDLAQRDHGANSAAEVASLREQLAKMQDQLTDATRSAAENRREAERVERQVPEVQKQRDLARSDLEDARTRISTLQDDVVTARSQCADVANQLTSAQIETDTLRYELQEAHKRAEDAMELRSAQQRLSDALQTETDTLEGHLRDSVAGNKVHERAACESREAVARIRLHAEEDTVYGMLQRVEARAHQALLHNAKYTATLAQLNDARTENDALSARSHAAEAALRQTELGTMATSASAKAEMADLLNQIKTVSTERDRRTEAVDRLTVECQNLSERVHRLQDSNTEAESALRVLEKRATEAEGALDFERLKSATTAATATKMETERTTMNTANLEMQAELERRTVEILDTRSTLQARVNTLEAELRSAAVNAKRDDTTLLKQLDTLTSERDHLQHLVQSGVEEARSLKMRLATLELEASTPQTDTFSETADNGLANVHAERLRGELAERDNAIFVLKEKLQQTTKAKIEAEKRERMAHRRLAEPPSPQPASVSPAFRGQGSDEEVERLRQEIAVLRNNDTNDRSEVETLRNSVRNKEMEVLMLRKEAEAMNHEMLALSDRCEMKLHEQQKALEESWKGREQGWVARHKALETQVAATSENLKHFETEKSALDHRAVRAEERLAMADERMAHSEAMKDEELQMKSEQLRQQGHEVQELRDTLRKLEAEAEHMRQYTESREHIVHNADAAAKQVKEVREDAKRREELLLNQIRTLMSQADAAKPIDNHRGLSPPLRHRSPHKIRTSSPWQMKSPDVRSRGALSPTSSSDGDEAEDAMILKAQLAAIEAQNETLRQLKAKEKEKRRDEGRLTDAQRQAATDAINDTAKQRAHSRLHQRGVGSPPRDMLREQLDSIASRVKSGNYDRKTVDEQLQQLLENVGRPVSNP